MNVINTVKEWANQNQGLLAIIVFIASLLISWISGFFKWILRKSKNNAPYISAGGDIKAGGDIIVGNKTIINKRQKNSKSIQGNNITSNKL